MKQPGSGDRCCGPDWQWHSSQIVFRVFYQCCGGGCAGLCLGTGIVVRVWLGLPRACRPRLCYGAFLEEGFIESRASCSPFCSLSNIFLYHHGSWQIEAYIQNFNFFSNG